MFKSLRILSARASSSCWSSRLGISDRPLASLSRVNAIQTLGILPQRRSSAGLAFKEPVLPDNLTVVDPKIFKSADRDVVPDASYYKARRPEVGNIRIPLYSFFNPNVTAIDEIVLDDRVFGSDVRIDIIHRVVRWQRANRRTGKKKVKTISDRTGTGRKPHPNHGTGRARQGTKRSVHMRKGGRVHGPVIRDYTFCIPKKVKRYAMRSVLAAKYIEKNIMVVDSLKPVEPYVKNGVIESSVVKNFLEIHKLGRTRVTFVDKKYPRGLELGSRPFPNVTKPFSFVTCNPYDILKTHKVVISLDSLRALEHRLQ